MRGSPGKGEGKNAACVLRPLTNLAQVSTHICRTGSGEHEQNGSVLNGFCVPHRYSRQSLPSLKLELAIAPVRLGDAQPFGSEQNKRTLLPCPTLLFAALRLDSAAQASEQFYILPDRVVAKECAAQCSATTI
jgi:hypothetical protein